MLPAECGLICMDNSICRLCGAQLVPQTSFCRQCGAAISPQESIPADERTTRLLDQTGAVATQRFDPRPTGPEGGSLKNPLTVESVEKKSGGKVILIGLLVLVIVAAIIAGLAIKRSHNRVASADGLIYPGSQTIVDVVSEGGGRALQLETSDSLQKVEHWYRDSMKPHKVLQLTPNSVVLKNEKASTTIVSEHNKSNILIKITP